ncbi:hypothetical protein KIY82_gp12 [Mycobacterium phage Centaur]|uniref:Uncharacterized protein n=1 Tax=Mycobacterium phage Centaur TaxID=2488784 RepID=A0A3G8FFG1_9CAUD|nr:hypothetical protein KIY82_gp12 [Mycobacterium phage Centaur]AOZ64038.1 hypothetical protein SEA_BAEHEXIC_94 [Mycobacterium phage Baehexic]AZF93479.1 hypothetical protein SEA_CENTAUR_95 [Mycobacterium phage Centaur]
MKIEHIPAREIREGDFVLTASAVNSSILYGDTVSQRYEYDEFTYINYGGMRWANDTVISVIREA